jgi:hypothetical protein
LGEAHDIIFTPEKKGICGIVNSIRLYQKEAALFKFVQRLKKNNFRFAFSDFPLDQYPETYKFTPSFIHAFQNLLSNWVLENIVSKNSWGRNYWFDGKKYNLGHVWQQEISLKFSCELLRFFRELQRIWFYEELPTDEPSLNLSSGDEIIVFLFISRLYESNQHHMLKSFRKSFQKAKFISFFIDYCDEALDYSNLTHSDWHYLHCYQNLLLPMYRYKLLQIDKLQGPYVLDYFKKLSTLMDAFFARITKGDFLALDFVMDIYKNICTVGLLEPHFYLHALEQIKKERSKSNTVYAILEFLETTDSKLKRSINKLRSYSFVDEEYDVASCILNKHINNYNELSNVFSAKLEDFKDYFSGYHTRFEHTGYGG